MRPRRHRESLRRASSFLACKRVKRLLPTPTPSTVKYSSKCVRRVVCSLVVRPGRRSATALVTVRLESGGLHVASSPRGHANSSHRFLIGLVARKGGTHVGLGLPGLRGGARRGCGSHDPQPPLFPFPSHTHISPALPSLGLCLDVRGYCCRGLQ